jgi:hypothetical protein
MPSFPIPQYEIQLTTSFQHTSLGRFVLPQDVVLAERLGVDSEEPFDARPPLAAGIPDYSARPI